MNYIEKNSESSSISLKGPKLPNLSQKIININKNLEYLGNEENSSVNINNSFFQEKSNGFTLDLPEILSSPIKFTSNTRKSVFNCQQHQLSPINNFNISKRVSSCFTGFIQANIPGISSGGSNVLPKEKSSIALKQFRKVNRVYMAIKKFRQRSKFRKADKLSSIHYNLINDLVFFKKKVEKNDIEASMKNSLLTSEKTKKFKSFCFKSFCVTEHIFKSIIHKIPVFKPNSLIRVVWDLIILLFIIFEFFAISVEISFDISFEDHFKGLRMINFLLFLFNILLNFNTFYYEYGVSVISHKRIAKNYLNTLFLYDFIALMALIPNMISIKMIELSYFSIFFFFIYKTMKKIIKNLQETYQIGDWFDLLSLLFKTLFLTHFIACLWYALGCYSKNYGDTNRSWLDINRIIDLPWQNKYLYSLYWVFMTLCTVGYGDITPQNSQEIGFCCAVMLMGTFAFGYCLNTVGALLNRMEESSKEMNKNMKIVDNFMHRKNINVNLRIKVKKYLEFLWESQNKTLEKEEEIIEKLPVSIKHEILLESNMKFLKDFSIITDNFTEEIIELLALNIKPIQYSPTDSIYNVGNRSNLGLFLIIDGEINLNITGSDKNQIVLKKLKKGDFFGEKPFFLNIGYQESAESIGFSTVYKIPRETMLEFLMNHQKDHEKFCEIRDKGLFFKENSIFQKCFSCKDADHSLHECPYLKYCPDKLFLIERLNFSRPQKRLFYNRQKTKKNSLNSKNMVTKGALKLRFDKNLMSKFYNLNTSQDNSDNDDSPKSLDNSSILRFTKSLENISDNILVKSTKKRFNSLSDLKSLESGWRSRKFSLDKNELDKIFKKDEEEEENEGVNPIMNNNEVSRRDKSEDSLIKHSKLNMLTNKHMQKSQELEFDKKNIDSNIFKRSEKNRSSEMINIEKNNNKFVQKKLRSGKVDLIKSIHSKEIIKFPRSDFNEKINTLEEFEKNHENNLNINQMKNTLKQISNQSKIIDKKKKKTDFSSFQEKSLKIRTMIIKEDDELLKNLLEKTTLFFIEFENMKEFNNYCVENNVSNVLKLIGISNDNSKSKSSLKISKKKNRK